MLCWFLRYQCKSAIHTSPPSWISLLPNPHPHCAGNFLQTFLIFKLCFWGLLGYRCFKCWCVPVYQSFLLWLLHFKSCIRILFYSKSRNIVSVFPCNTLEFYRFNSNLGGFLVNIFQLYVLTMVCFIGGDHSVVILITY